MERTVEILQPELCNMHVQKPRTHMGKHGNMQLHRHHRETKNHNKQSKGLPGISGQTDHKEKQQSIGYVKVLMKRREGE